MESAAYIATNLVKNSLAPFLIPLRRSRGCFGMDGDLDAVFDVLERLSPTLGGLEASFHGSQVLELGVGRTAEVCASALLAGAEHAHGVDVEVQLDADATLGTQYRALADRLVTGAAPSFLAAVGSGPAAVQARAERLGTSTWPMTFTSFAGSSLDLPGGSIDVILSKSVLEHVRRRDVRPLLRELHRVLRPGGIMAHIIDLRDHMHIDRDRAVRGDWLDALRYSDRLFEAMFSNRSTSINRLRVGEWRTAFTEAGLELCSEKHDVFELPTGFDRTRLQPRYRDVSDEDLRVGFLTVGVRRPVH